MVRYRYRFLVTLLVLTGACQKSDSSSHSLTLQQRIFDRANLLNPVQEDSIFQLIQTLDSEIGSQIAILTVASLDGKSIEEFSFSQANTMGIGRKDFDDGILITVAFNNQQMRIEVGYGLERIITDEIASQINREIIAPHFRQANFSRGIREAVEAIKQRIEVNQSLVGKRL